MIEQNRYSKLKILTKLQLNGINTDLECCFVGNLVTLNFHKKF